jgi:hypothetical protein
MLGPLSLASQFLNRWDIIGYDGRYFFGFLGGAFFNFAEIGVWRILFNINWVLFLSSQFSRVHS